jgi:hypothetical protein
MNLSDIRRDAAIPNEEEIRDMREGKQGPRVFQFQKKVNHKFIAADQFQFRPTTEEQTNSDCRLSRSSGRSG